MITSVASNRLNGKSTKAAIEDAVTEFLTKKLQELDGPQRSYSEGKGTVGISLDPPSIYVYGVWARTKWARTNSTKEKSCYLKVISIQVFYPHHKKGFDWDEIIHFIREKGSWI